MEWESIEPSEFTKGGTFASECRLPQQLEHDEFEQITILGFHDTNTESGDGYNLYLSVLQMVYYSPIGMIKGRLSNLNQSGKQKRVRLKRLLQPPLTTKYYPYVYCARISAN